MDFKQRVVDKVRPHFAAEIEAAKQCVLRKEIHQAWAHLESSHILGQRYLRMHLLSHLEMIKLGIKLRDFKEIFGQIVHIFLAVPGSLLGRLPIGNTGRSNVNMFKPMVIPERLKKIIAE